MGQWMVLHQQYISICAAARRKGEGEESMRKMVTMRGHNTAHAPSRSPRHRPWISWRRGLSRLGQEKPGQGPMILSLHPPLESKTPISPGRSPILSSSLRERIWAQILVPMATAPVYVSMCAGCCCSCRRGDPLTCSSELGPQET